MSMVLSLTALLAAGPAWGNGQTTHVWISHHAITHLPEGPLRSLLETPANQAALVHGTMFPDGGYPLDHPYAETAHWEPFQTRYRDWIQDQFEAPFTDDAARHVAFFLGLASHGMADQTFDAFYFNWSSIKDADHGWAAGESFDEASDFVFASHMGGQEVPERWVPKSTLIELYEEAGVSVTEATLDRGQALLETAIALVSLGSQNPDLVASYAERFPWGSEHLTRNDLPGSPACAGVWVARYWEHLFSHLTTGDSAAEVLGLWPADGTTGLHRDHTQPESRLSIVFANGMASGEPDPGYFSVQSASGEPLPVSVWVYYGSDSHVVHLVPEQDWPADTELSVTARSGLPFRDDGALQSDVRWTVSTEIVEDREDPAPASSPAQRSCGVSATHRSSVTVLLALIAAVLRRAGSGGPPTLQRHRARRASPATATLPQD